MYKKKYYQGNRFIEVEVKTLNRKTRIDSLRGSLEMKSLQNLERSISLKIDESLHHRFFNRLINDLPNISAYKVIELLNKKLGGH